MEHQAKERLIKEGREQQRKAAQKLSKVYREHKAKDTRLKSGNKNRMELIRTERKEQTVNLSEAMKKV